MKTLFLALLSITISVAAQFLLKAGINNTDTRSDHLDFREPQSIIDLMLNKYIVGGLILYGLGAILWLAVLAKWDVSKAYPLVGLGFALTLFVGFFLGENITLVRALGVLFICTGVALVSYS